MVDLMMNFEFSVNLSKIGFKNFSNCELALFTLVRMGLMGKFSSETNGLCVFGLSLIFLRIVLFSGIKRKYCSRQVLFFLRIWS